MIAATLSPWFVIFAWLVVGNRQHALGILAHDGAHRLVAKDRKLNDLITNWFTFYPLMIPIRTYRLFHFAHHRNVNNEHDPEIPLKSIGPCKMEPPFTQRKVITHSLLDLIGFGLPQIVGFLYHVRAKQPRDYIAYFPMPVVAAALITTDFWVAVPIWFVSLWTTFWCCFRLRVWSEHVGLGEGETLVYKPKLWQQILFLPHGSAYHAEHHSYPNTPFNMLGTLFQDVDTSLCEARTNDACRNQTANLGA
jgi:fatty acid desaturase